MELSDRSVFHQRKLPSSCFAIFYDMKEKRKLCDIAIQFENRSISAHRLVLAAAIPYFQDICTQQTESDTGGIIIEGIDPEALESLIDYAYTCQVQITGDNVQGLLQASCTLNIEDVREACCEFIGKRLSPANVLIVREMAEKLSCLNLVKRTDSYVCDNFDEVAQTEDFLDAPCNFIKKLYASNELRTSNEENVFQSIIKWVKKSPDDRKGELPELLSNARLTLLTPDYVMDHVMTEKYIWESIQCRDLLDKVKFYHLLPHRKPEFSSLDALPRPYPLANNQSTVSGIYAICKEVKLKVVCLNSEEGKWRTIETVPFSQHGSVTACNDKIYFADYDNLRICIPPNDQWVISRNYRPGRIYAGTAVINKKFYMCGGLYKGTASETVHVLDLEKQTSRAAASMSIARNLVGVVVLGDYLYAVGGVNGVCVHDSVERYDHRSNRWDMMSPMNIKRYGMGCTTMGGKIYVCGGNSENEECLSSVEVYDPVINEWKCISSMNTSRFYCSLAAYCGKLYAVGGYGIHEYLNSVEIYNPRTDEWKFGCPMDSAYTDVRAVAFPFVNE